MNDVIGREAGTRLLGHIARFDSITENSAAGADDQPPLPRSHLTGELCPEIV
jgi:hypothetical protein